MTSSHPNDNQRSNRSERTYLIGYEILGDASAAHRLEHAIVRCGGRWARPLSGLWYIETEASVSELTASLSGHVADEDALLVHEVTGSPSIHNTHLRWSKSYLTQPVQNQSGLREPATQMLHNVVPLRTLSEAGARGEGSIDFDGSASVAA